MGRKGGNGWAQSQGKDQAAMVHNQLTLRRKNLTLRNYDEIALLETLAMIEGPSAVIQPATELLKADRYGLNSPIVELMNRIDRRGVVQGVLRRFWADQSRDGDYTTLLRATTSDCEDTGTCRAICQRLRRQAEGRRLGKHLRGHCLLLRRPLDIHLFSVLFPPSRPPIGLDIRRYGKHVLQEAVDEFLHRECIRLQAVAIAAIPMPAADLPVYAVLHFDFRSKFTSFLPGFRSACNVESRL